MFYFQRLRIPPHIKEQYPDKIDALSRHEFHGMNLEIIHFKNMVGNDALGLGKQKIISARINQQNRFIFLLGQISGEWELVFLCVTPHDYKNTLKKCKQKLKQIGYVLPDTDDYEFIEVQPEALQLKNKNASEKKSFTPVTHINRQWIAYTDNQFSFMNLEQMHLVLSGPPGSGKTLSMLGQLAERSMNPLEENIRVLWIAPTQNLVDETRAQWLQMAEQQHLAVSFMTYKNWLSQNRAPSTATEMSQELFSKSLAEWLNQITNRKKAVVSKEFRKLLLDNVDAVRYELSLISVIGNDEYLNKGSRQSYFTDTDERTVLAALSDYYQLFLLDNQMIDPLTEEVQGWQKYDLVIIDEGQNLPPRAYANLRYSRTVIGLDSRQCIETAPYIESFITQDLLQGQGQKMHHLTGTYRCSEMVTELANHVLELIDEVSPKARTTSYKTVVSSTGQKGSVRVYDKLQGEWTAELKELAQDPDTLVITSLKGTELETVFKAIDPQLLLTPGQAIGLTFKRVIFLSPLAGLEAGLIEKRLQSPDDSPLLFKERSYLNSMLVGLMRAADEVIVVQDNVTNRSKLYQSLFNYYAKKAEPAKPQQKEKSVIDSAKQREKWQRNRDALLEIGDTAQAEKITRNHLDTEPTPIAVTVKEITKSPANEASSSVIPAKKTVKKNKKKSVKSDASPVNSFFKAGEKSIDMQIFDMVTRKDPFPLEQDYELLRHLKKFPEYLFKTREKMIFEPFANYLLISENDRLHFYLSQIPEAFEKARELVRQKRCEYEVNIIKRTAFEFLHIQTLDWLEGKNSYLYPANVAQIQNMLDGLSFWRAEGDVSKEAFEEEHSFYRDLCMQWQANIQALQGRAAWASFPVFNDIGLKRGINFFTTLKCLTDRLSIAKPSLNNKHIAYLLYIMLYDLTSDSILFSAAEIIEVESSQGPMHYIFLNRSRFMPLTGNLNNPSLVVIDINKGQVFDHQSMNQCNLFQMAHVKYEVECIGLPLKSAWDLGVAKILEHKVKLGFKMGMGVNMTSSVIESIETCAEPVTHLIELLTLSAKRINTVARSGVSDEEHMQFLSNCSGALSKFDYLMKKVPDSLLSKLLLARNSPYQEMVHTLLVTGVDEEQNSLEHYLSANKGKKGAPYYLVRAKIWLTGILLSEQLFNNQPLLFAVIRPQNTWWHIPFHEYRNNAHFKSCLDEYFKHTLKEYSTQAAMVYCRVVPHIPELNMELVGDMLVELAQHADTDFKIEFIAKHLELKRFSLTNHLLFSPEVAAALLEKQNHVLIVKMLQDPCWHNFVARLFAFNPEVTRMVLTAAGLIIELEKSLTLSPYGLQLMIQIIHQSYYTALDMSEFLNKFPVSNELIVPDKSITAMTLYYTKIVTTVLEQLSQLNLDGNRLHRLVQPHVSNFCQFMGILSCAIVQAKQNNMHLSEEYRAYLFLFHMYEVRQSPQDQFYFPMTLIKTLKDGRAEYFVVKSYWLTSPLTESISYLLNPQCTVIDCSTGISASGQEFLDQHGWSHDSEQLPVETATPNIFFYELLHSAALAMGSVPLKLLVNKLGESTLDGLDRNLRTLIEAKNKPNPNGLFTPKAAIKEDSKPEQPKIQM